MKNISILSTITNIIWPRACAACNSRLPFEGNQLFCDLCAESLLEIESPLCPRCALPFEGAGPDHLCTECLVSPPAFSATRALYHYGEAAANAITRLKFGPMPELAPLLGFQLGHLITSLPSPDIIVPVPLHKKRLLERGFNQAALLSRAAARHIQKPVRYDAVVRVRQTKAQTGLSAAERRTNLKGAFNVKNPASLKGRRVLVIDDVITTGATLREVSTVIANAGAADVVTAAVARAC